MDPFNPDNYENFFLKKELWHEFKDADGEFDKKAYKAYMREESIKYKKSQLWRDKRQHMFSRYGERCEICGDCGEGTIIQVHHNAYARPAGAEYDCDLIILCKDCHSSFHKKYPGWLTNKDIHESTHWRKKSWTDTNIHSSSRRNGIFAQPRASSRDHHCYICSRRSAGILELEQDNAPDFKRDMPICRYCYGFYKERIPRRAAEGWGGNRDLLTQGEIIHEGKQLAQKKRDRIERENKARKKKKEAKEERRRIHEEYHPRKPQKKKGKEIKLPPKHTAESRARQEENRKKKPVIRQDHRSGKITVVTRRSSSSRK